MQPATDSRPKARTPLSVGGASFGLGTQLPLEELLALAARGVNPFAVFGCEVNALSPEALFACYERVGFLYPAKLERLRPIWLPVLDTWRRMLEAGNELLTVVTTGDPASHTWASITSWRTTTNGWATQHQVSIGDPVASRATMLSRTAQLIRDQFGGAHQCWFRPSNRYPRKLFGSVTHALGAEHAVVNTLHYVDVPLPVSPADGAERGFSILDVAAQCRAELIDLATLVRGRVFVEGEELDRDDLNLEALDERYRAIGLRRYRYVRLALDRNTGTPLGATIAYRGPLGINFSLLENRCDLLVRPTLPDALRRDVAAALLHETQVTYENFELRRMFLTTDAVTASVLSGPGVQLIREYSQSLWMGRALPAMYRHLDGFYARVLEFERRRHRSATAAPEQHHDVA